MSEVTYFLNKRPLKTITSQIACVTALLSSESNQGNIALLYLTSASDKSSMALNARLVKGKPDSNCAVLYRHIPKILDDPVRRVLTRLPSWK